MGRAINLLIALNRKSARFAGHDEGVATWGRIASLIETEQLNGVNSCDWLMSLAHNLFRFFCRKVS